MVKRASTEHYFVLVVVCHGKASKCFV